MAPSFWVEASSVFLHADYQLYPKKRKQKKMASFPYSHVHVTRGAFSNRGDSLLTLDSRTMYEEHPIKLFLRWGKQIEPLGVSPK